MRIGHLYPINSIHNVLKGFRLIEINNNEYSEDYGDYTVHEFRLTNQPEITHFHTSYGLGRWESAKYIDLDGNEHEVHSVTFHGEPEDTIKVHDILSPKLKIHDKKYIEKTSELDQWLKYIKADIEALDAEAIEIKHYEKIEYPGVADVILCKYRNSDKEYFSFSSETLVLDEREIESVLNGIEDKLLREKIKSILYARVFKRK